MTAYGRSGSVWEGGVLRGYDGAAWTGVADNGYVWNGTEWVLFQPFASSLLEKPTNIVVTPSDFAATVTWTNPTQVITPTHVQIRVPETTSVWTELVYPATTETFAFLTPSTSYQVQIRYIVREDGSITATGPIGEAFFTTTAPSGPGTPAADPGGTGPDSIITWPDTVGTPGAVGSGGCWWEYVVQTANTPASGAIVFSDTAVTDEIAGDIGDLQVDFVAAGLSCGALARLKYREVCNSVPGDWAYGAEFIMPCDWSAACAGLADSTQFLSAPWTDPNAIFAFPQACADTSEINSYTNSTMRIEDAVAAGVIYGKLPGYGSLQGIGGEHVVFGKTTNGTLGKATLGGKVGALALLEDADDLSVCAGVWLEEVPGGSGGGGGTAPASFPFVRFGKNVALSAVFSTTTTYKIRATWIDANGDFQSLTSTTSLALEEYHIAALTLDSDGTKTLYIDGVAEATNTDNIACAFSDAGIGQDIEVYTNEFMRFKSCGGWDRVLTAEEVALLNAPPYPYYVAENAELITASSTSFTHTLPSGISAGDMIMVLWRTNDTASAKTWGATPAGWTAGNEQYATKLYYKIADGTETDMTLTWTGASGAAGANQGVVHSLVYRNVDSVNPFLVEPAVQAGNSGSQSFWDSPGVDPATSDSAVGSPTNLDNFTSFMEGTTFAGVFRSTTVPTVSASTLYQPNIAERATTLGSHYLRSWSHEGITENSGLYNDQSARWTHASAYNNGFAAILRAPRTDEWNAKTHVAYKRTTLGYSAFDSALITTADVAHFDGLLALVITQDTGSATPTVDHTTGVNTWMTPLSHGVYYGTWAAAGRQIRIQGPSTYLVTSFIIANANTSDPASAVIQRRYNTQSAGRANYFWTRTDQLVIGHIRSNNYDVGQYTAGASTAISVEHQDFQVNTSAGNQTGHVIYGRGLVNGYGFLPALTAATNWDLNSVAYVGINHSTESSPSLATPTIVGTPTVQTKSVGGPGTLVITKPSGCQVGEMILMITHLEAGGEIQSNAPGPPAGFEPLDHDSSGAGTIGEPELWYKVVDGTEPATWSPSVNGQGTIVLQRVTGILPMLGFRHSEQSGTIANPQPFGTPNVYKPGITLRVGAYQDSTARVVAVSVGTDIVADIDVPPGGASTTHLNIKGEVIAGTTPGAANFTLTPFPGAPSTSRGGVYHLTAGPA